MANRVKLDDLENRSADLKTSVFSVYQSSQFEAGATKLRRRHEWEQYRIYVALGALGLVDSSQQISAFLLWKVL